jgi:hypothetical protein
MRKQFWGATAVVLIAGGIMTYPASGAKTMTRQGWITDSECAAAQGISRADAECARDCVKYHNAKFVMYTPELKTVILQPQDKAAQYAGRFVSVRGTRHGDAVEVISIVE